MELSIIHYLTPTTATVLMRPQGILLEELDVSYPIENQLRGMGLSTCGKYYVLGLNVFPREEVAAAIGKLAALLAEISKHVKSPSDKKEVLVGLIGTDGEYHLIEEELYKKINAKSIALPKYSGTRIFKGFTLIDDRTCGSTMPSVVVKERSGRKSFTYEARQDCSYNDAVTINDHSYNTGAIVALRSQLQSGKLTGWSDYSFSEDKKGKILITYIPTGVVCPPLKRSDLQS